MTRGVFRVLIAADAARAALSYDPATGEFRHAAGRRNAGKKAGFAWGCGRGYRGVSVDGEGYFAHRIAWLISYGRWPEGDVDHINGDKSDNRLENLRDVPRWLNVHNGGVRRDSGSGVRGVWRAANGRWRAYIRLHGKTKHLGYFGSLQEAADARAAAGKTMLPTCPVAEKHFEGPTPSKEPAR